VQAVLYAGESLTGEFLAGSEIVMELRIMRMTNQQRKTIKKGTEQDELQTETESVSERKKFIPRTK